MGDDGPRSLVDFATNEATGRPARLVYLDIETAPNLAYVWGHYEQNVIEHVAEWYVLCAGWKWEGTGEVESAAQIEDPKAFAADPCDDIVVMAQLWSVLDQANIVVAHNGDRFDLRKVNARFAVHGWEPPSPYKTVDTLKAARRYFAFNSNRLNDLGRTLELGAKAGTGGFGLWRGCMDGDDKAWAKMVRYNRQDVRLLQRVYKRLRPYMANHPNMANEGADPAACPICGADEKHLTENGIFRTSTVEYQRWRCDSCHGFSRSRRRFAGAEQIERVNVTRR